MATRRVKFIGPTVSKRDNVCRSNLLWKFRGAIQVAPEDIAIRLFTHPDVWVEPDEDDKGLPMDELSPLIQLKAGMTADERINLAIKIIEKEDCLLEVMGYFGNSLIVDSDDGVNHQANYERLLKIEADEANHVEIDVPDHAQGPGEGIIGDGLKEAAKISDVIAFSPVREDAIIEAINALDRDSDAHFTKDGIPRVEAISGLLGYEVAASERTAAWDTIQEGEGS